jgi:hypothetical protein
MTDLAKQLAGLGNEFGMETGNWEYPTIGYNATDGVFYIGDGEAKDLEIVIFAVRRCKEVTTPAGNIVRYHPYFKKHEMEVGDVQQRLQAVVMVNGELHLFGAKSWTARALFDNASDGKYADENYMPGLWEVLVKWIKNVKASHGAATSPYCWLVKLSTGKAFKNPQDKRREITPIVYSPTPFTFVGKEKAAEHKALYESEDLKAWQDEWHKAGGVKAQTEASVEPGAMGVKEDSLDDIPGFDL